MTIRVYSSLDTGAPILPNLSSQRLIDNLRIVLKACLVDGYAGKPAAGWTPAHDHADGFSLSNGEGIISFVHNKTSAVQVYLMEAITNGSAALPEGANRRSGPWFEGSTTSNRHWVATTFSGTSSNKAWVLVADEKTATLYVRTGTDLLARIASGGMAGIHFGRYYPALGGVGFCCLGGSINDYSTNIRFWSTVGASNYTGTSLRNPFDGLVDQGLNPYYSMGDFPGYSINGSISTKAKFMPRIARLMRMSVRCWGVGLSGGTEAAGSIQCGMTRGLLTEPFICSAHPSQALVALGISSPTREDMLRPMTVAGKQLVPIWPHSADLGGFVSLDPNDWEPLWT